jgi:hypothetical protein
MEQLTEERLDQAFRALEVANGIRLARAADKKLIKVGRRDAAVILRNPPVHWRSAKVIDLLVSMNRVGRRKAGMWLKLHVISPTRRIEEMTKRERFALARNIDVWQGRRDRVRNMMEGRAA